MKGGGADFRGVKQASGAGHPCVRNMVGRNYGTPWAPESEVRHKVVKEPWAGDSVGLEAREDGAVLLEQDYVETSWTG
jgi:hypothetical protein